MYESLVPVVEAGGDRDVCAKFLSFKNLNTSTICVSDPNDFLAARFINGKAVFRPCCCESLFGDA
jgi:hypothetical protein